VSHASPVDTIEVRGVRLRRDPARESCYKVVHLLTEMRNAGIDTPIELREFVHRDVNNEIQSVEIAAQTLADFPDAPWELRLCLARQCWDESRHAKLYYTRLRELGGYKGEFPITNHEWGVACIVGTLAARLAIQNRAFEAGSLDVFLKMAQAFREIGDERTAEITEGILNDEIQHVRFANRWVKQLVKDNPRVLLEIAEAVEQTNRIMHAMAPQEGEFSIDGVELAARRPVFNINVDDRSLADFSDEDLRAMLHQEQERRRKEAEAIRAEEARQRMLGCGAAAEGGATIPEP